MNSTEKARCTELDTEKSEMDIEKSGMDTEKKTRRSSILKPQKPRNPLSTLDFTEPNPDNTLGRPSRRVSFASSNFVKPFAADPEKNTIWDNTYEEEVNHTDSTKSSYDQTQEAKSTNLFNLTSPPSDNESFKDISPLQIIYPESGVSTSKSDSLVSFVRISNNKPALETCSSSKKTIYTKNFVEIKQSVRVEDDVNNISLISPLNDTTDSALTENHTHMDITACINKENVNPIINDIALVTPMENKLRRSARLKDRCINTNVVQGKTLKENIDLPFKNHPEKVHLPNCLGQTVIFSQCDMELTESLSVMDIRTNSKTTYFHEENMEFTQPLDVKDQTDLYGTETKFSKKDTVVFNRTDGDMEFTLPISLEKNREIDNTQNKSVTQLEHCEADMDLAATLPLTGDIILGRNHENKFNLHERTIHFDDLGDDIEFTGVLPVTNIITTSHPIVNYPMNLNDCDLKYAPILADKENVKIENSVFTKRRTINFENSEDDMEFTNLLPVTNIQKTPLLTVTNDMHLKQSNKKNISIFTNNGTNVAEDSKCGKEKTICFSHVVNDMDRSGNSKTDLQMKLGYVGIDMDCTSLPITDILVKNERSNSNPKRKTIHFNQSEDDMKFTATLPVIENRNVNTHIDVEDMEFNSSLLNDKINKMTDAAVQKRKTIHFNASDTDMEFTAALPVADINVRQIYGVDSNKKSVCLDQLEGDIEGRDTFSKKETSTRYHLKHIQSNDEEGMEFTSSFVDKNAIVEPLHSKNPEKTIRFAQSEVNMEFTNNLSAKNEQINREDTILMEKGCNQTEADVEFAADLTIRNQTVDNRFCKRNTVEDKRTDTLNNSKLNNSKNQMEIMDISGSIADVLPKLEENKRVRRASLIKTNEYSDNSETNHNVIKKIKIDELSKSLIEKKMHAHKIEYEMDKYPDKNNKEWTKVTDIKANENQIQSDEVSHKVIVSPSAISHNILYSEPMKIHLKTHNFTPSPDLSDNLNLQSLKDSLNLNLVPVSTPVVSFHMNLSNTSPCIEDTQQFLQATFSRPESLKMLLLDKETIISSKEHGNILCSQKENISSDTINIEKSMDKIVGETHIANEKTFTSVQCMGIENSYVEKTFLLKESDFELDGVKENRDSNPMEMSKESSDNRKLEKSCYIEDTSLVDLAPADQEDLSLVSNPMPNEHVHLKPAYKTSQQDESSNNADTSSNHNNSTLRCQSILANIAKHLIPYKVEKHNYSKIKQQVEQLERNDLIIRDLIKNFRIPKIPITNLEEKYKQDLENASSSVNEAVMDADDIKGAPSMAGIKAPKSLYNRICEAAERSKKHWKLGKMVDDYYYFLTLFGTLPFKVHVHSELGIVYSVETYTNLEAVAKPICWYEFKLFQQKLKGENLQLVLGAKFDILTLLDYVSMTMEEVINFHMEYNKLIEKYGRTHHFRMTNDFNVIFEIINIDLIICWTITIKMCPIGSISKDDVSATYRLKEPVNEEHIKCIAENTPKGPNFLRNFIENIDEYVERIGKKIKFRRGDKS